MCADVPSSFRLQVSSIIHATDEPTLPTTEEIEAGTGQPTKDDAGENPLVVPSSSTSLSFHYIPLYY